MTPSTAVWQNERHSGSSAAACPARMSRGYGLAYARDCQIQADDCKEAFPERAIRPDVTQLGEESIMCGVAGAIDVAEDRAAARVGMINDSQSHRGPDHHVQVRLGVFTLGNTRLAIQDPSPAGNQPFVSVDGRYHCVFNGEIYNYRQLIERYHLPVHTACDGEVISALDHVG